MCQRCTQPTRQRTNFIQNCKVSASRSTIKVLFLPDHKPKHSQDDSITQCAVVLGQLENITHALVTSLNSVFVDQLEKLVQSEELINIYAMKEKVSNSKRQVDAAYRKLLEHKAEKPSEAEPKLQKSVEDGTKQLDEVLAEGLRKAEQWDKAARQEISSALTACTFPPLSVIFDLGAY